MRVKPEFKDWIKMVIFGWPFFCLKEIIMKYLTYLSLLMILLACGDDSPFDEDYWDDNSRSQDQEERQNTGTFFADLRPVSALSFVNGDASLELNGNEAFLQIEMEGVPQNLVQGQVAVTDTPCTDIVANPPTTGTIETKNYTYTENGTRAALFRDLVPGETVEGKTLLVYAFSTGSTTTGASGLFPLACGPILASDSTTTGTTTATTGGATTATTGGIATGGFPTGGAGTTGGTIGATTGGAVGGTTGGAVGGTTGGTVGGTAAGGATVGGVDGGVDGAIGGVDGGIGGAIGGVDGSAAGTIGGIDGATGGTAGGTTAF
jgi:hypothetical protein